LRKTDYVKPEQVKAFELGYRSFIEGFSVDVNGYYNIYNDFIGNLNAPLYGTAQESGIPSADPGFQSVHALANSNFRAFQLYTNTKVEIKSLGFGLGSF
jgi:outer membrane receptor protein involved in Fe transport